MVSDSTMQSDFGHYLISFPIIQKSCVHMRPNSGALSARFEVRVGQCGLSSSGNLESNGQPNPAGSYLENTIIVQYDPQVQEVWDQGGQSPTRHCRFND